MLTIPFGLTGICTVDTDFESNAHKLTGYYLKRGYPFKSLKKHYHKAKAFTQVLVTQFNPANTDIRKLVRQNWNIMQNCDEIEKVCKDLSLIGLRKLPNLRNILTSSTITYPPIKYRLSKKTLIPTCTRLGKCLEFIKWTVSPGFTQRKPTNANPYHLKLA